MACCVRLAEPIRLDAVQAARPAAMPQPRRVQPRPTELWPNPRIEIAAPPMHSHRIRGKSPIVSEAGASGGVGLARATTTRQIIAANTNAARSSSERYFEDRRA